MPSTCVTSCTPGATCTAGVFLLAVFLTAPQHVSMSSGMFRSISKKSIHSDANPKQLNYGIAVSDVDGDGDFEWIVAGFSGPNLVLKWNSATKKLENLATDDPNSKFYHLRDPQGQAIGVCACDVDGDGAEEVYFLNTNDAFAGKSSYGDKLFKYRNGKYEDVLSDKINADVSLNYAGRSVACVDREGTGRYAVYVANYARGRIGPHRLIELDEEQSDVSKGILKLKDVASEAGVAKFTGGRGVVVGPILSNASDVFCVNENGGNFLFVNQGDGTFQDLAQPAGVLDPRQHGRGLALADFNGDEKIDIVYGNWLGPHRLYIQQGEPDNPEFQDIATEDFAKPSPIRTVLAADFDNDGHLEVFFNNIVLDEEEAPNRLFRVKRKEDGSLRVSEVDIGDAREPYGYGTGGSVADVDGDGSLEVLLSHGEDTAQPLTLYKVRAWVDHNWIRVFPRTQHGGPARGAKVVVETSDGKRQLRVIDGGSGYLCQMEPVAHFGLRQSTAWKLEVTWPDGTRFARGVKPEENRTTVTVEYPTDSDAGHKEEL
ncbi:cartilage acidic protein 1-like [Branchiostoma floridae x Branchiostoma belcheri]